MTYHHILGLTDIHSIHNWEYADEAERTGASGFVAADIGKVARQLDDESYYILTSTDPTWTQISGGGGSGSVTSAQGADGYLAFFTGSDAIAGDNDLFWDRETNRLGIGTSEPTTSLTIVNGDASIHGDNASWANYRYGDFGNGPANSVAHARGTYDSPQALQSGDDCGRFQWMFYDGSAWQWGAQIYCEMVSNRWF